MPEEVNVLSKNRALGKLCLSSSSQGGEAIQMGGKLLLRIEAVLNIVGLKMLPFLFPPPSGSLLPPSGNSILVLRVLCPSFLHKRYDSQSEVQLYFSVLYEACVHK